MEDNTILAAVTTAEQVMPYLKQVREAAGLSQQEVADKIGKTKSTVSKWEGMELLQMKWGSLCRYASSLGLSVHIELVPTSKTHKTAQGKRKKKNKG